MSKLPDHKDDLENGQMSETDSMTISADELLARFGHSSASATTDDNRATEEREQRAKLSDAPQRPGEQQQQGDNKASHHTSYRTFEVETYENQRWYPLKGWSSTLLPTDRSKWSSKDGKTKLTKESFEEAKDANGKAKYDFCGDWEPYVVPKETDMDGWCYAVDYPADYHAESFFGVCVRRRLWTRKFRVPS